MQMKPATLDSLPPPPAGKVGWPWTEGGPALPDSLNGKPWPLVSIVTPSFRQGRFLEETIRSVLLQGYSNLEYLVIDGGSDDESVEIIKKYQPWLTYSCSEPDRGQTHAINKGLARARGEIFQWINSDDALTPGAVGRVASHFEAQDVVAGAVIDYDDAGIERLIVNAGLDPDRLIWRGGGTFHQPGIWLRRATVEACGGLNERFHYAFDWDLYLRYAARPTRVAYIPDVLVRFRLHDASKTVSLEHKFGAERAEILLHLLSSDRFEQLHEACEKGLRHYAWWRTLARLRRDSAESRARRVLRIARAACQDPRIRWNRATLGAIRYTLMGAL
jgi:glycosyltransferase involved in cell wall biosynthesis